MNLKVKIGLIVTASLAASCGFLGTTVLDDRNQGGKVADQNLAKEDDCEYCGYPDDPITTDCVDDSVSSGGQYNNSQNVVIDIPEVMPVCNEIFRTADGTNNNLKHPTWGSAGIAHLRRTGNGYEDGIHEPRQYQTRNPRAISNKVMDQEGDMPNQEEVSDFIWQWGQFIDHDIVLTKANGERLDIEIPVGDPVYDPNRDGGKTFRFTRSEAKPKTEGVYHQINSISAFIDASMVYGSDLERQKALRRMDGSGKMKVSEGNLLPFNTEEIENEPATTPNFFLAGDVRANEQVGLSSLHTLFVREHNTIVNKLKVIWPDLSGEKLFQYAKAIVTAQIQRVTYKEYIPLLLGDNYLQGYLGYDPDVNPGIEITFSTVAYRHGHSMLSNVINRLDKNLDEIPEGHLSLKDAFFDPRKIIDEGGIDPVLRGLALNRSQMVDTKIVDGVRNFLFGGPGIGGFDLASLNIQRGRDHGIPSYNDVREELGLERMLSINDITYDPEKRALLKDVYQHVDEIDAWVGGLAEEPMPRALIGEMFLESVLDQFKRLRDGDRFFYKRYLTQPWVDWVEKQTLASIVRRNTNIGEEIPSNMFFVKD